MNNNKVTYIAAGVVGILVLLFIFDKVFIPKLVDRIVKDMRKNYVPGPFEPGYDLDKVDPSFIRPKSLGQTLETTPNSVFEGQKVPFLTPEEWNRSWEQKRH